MNLALDIDTLYDDVKDYVAKGEQPCRLAEMVARIEFARQTAA